MDHWPHGESAKLVKTLQSTAVKERLVCLRFWKKENHILKNRVWGGEVAWDTASEVGEDCLLQGR